MITLSAWTNERHLYLLAGIELAAHKLHGEDWQIKTSRCSMCGKCCENFTDDDYLPITNGICDYLVDDGGGKKICSLGSDRPYSCCIGLSDLPDCTEKFE